MKITQKHIEAAFKAEASRKAEAVKVEETAAEVRSEKTEKIIAAVAGMGKVWEKGGKVRVYLYADKAMESAGWEVSRYQSGAIMSAKKDGEKVSNNRAWKVSMSLYGAYVDAVTGEVVCEDAEVRAAVEAIIAAALKAEETEEEKSEAADDPEEAKILTAEEVIARAGLEDEKSYMQTDTGAIDTGAGWKATLRKLEADGMAEYDSAFAADGDGAHLVEVGAATGKGKVISATYSIFGENDGDLIADGVEYWGEVAGMTAAEAAEKVAGDVLDTCGGDHDNYLADAGINIKAEFPTIYTTAEDDTLAAGHELRSYSFCGRNYDAEIVVDVLVEVEK